jgi:hypothetical protein
VPMVEACEVQVLLCRYGSGMECAVVGMLEVDVGQTFV